MQSLNISGAGCASRSQPYQRSRLLGSRSNSSVAPGMQCHRISSPSLSEQMPSPTLEGKIGSHKQDLCVYLDIEIYFIAWFSPWPAYQPQSSQNPECPNQNKQKIGQPYNKDRVIISGLTSFSPRLSINTNNNTNNTSEHHRLAKRITEVSPQPHCFSGPEHAYSLNGVKPATVTRPQPNPTIQYIQYNYITSRHAPRQDDRLTSIGPRGSIEPTNSLDYGGGSVPGSAPDLHWELQPSRPTTTPHLALRNHVFFSPVAPAYPARHTTAGHTDSAVCPHRHLRLAWSSFPIQGRDQERAEAPTYRESQLPKAVWLPLLFNFGFFPTY